MNSRVHPPWSAGSYRAVFRLLLYLGPMAATSVPLLTAVTVRAPSPRPYLSMVGAPALRFAESAPPPDLSVRPPPSGGTSPPPATADPAAAPVAKLDDTSAVEAATPAASAGTLPAQREGKTKQPKPPILPDDTHPMVRPEDFLPFFQFPNANPNLSETSGTPGAPAPRTPPPSTATYRLQ